MGKLKVLDLFCGGGGAGEGYHRAGFYVLGCDVEPQPKNPHDFVQGDWLKVLTDYAGEFDLVHASPPCQKYSKACKQWRKAGVSYPDLISSVRSQLKKIGKPYVIENVPGSPLENPIRLNGSFFKILVHRPRLFETSFKIDQPIIPITKQPVKMGRPITYGDIIQPVGHFSGVWYAQMQMQISWLGQKELAQAIPPAYTEWIGKKFIESCGVNPLIKQSTG